MADQVVLEQSLESQIVDEPFVSRQQVYVIDSNNGSYNGQIQIDTSSLSNSGRWVSYSEGVIEVPLVVTLQALNGDTTGYGSANAALNAQTAAIANLRKEFAVGLKAGHFQLIHSLAVEYNNTSVVQLTPYLNHFVSYKMLTTLDDSDLRKWGDSIGFFADSAMSHDYIQADVTTSTNAAGVGNVGTAGLSSSGWGSVNNKNVPSMGSFTDYVTNKQKNAANEGFMKRTLGNAANATSGKLTTSTVTSSDKFSVQARNYYQQATTSNYTDVWYVMASIRLKDIADFFDKLPLTRGAYLRLLINTNTASHTYRYTVVAATDSAANAVGVPAFVSNIKMASTTVVGGSTPLMIASADGIDNAAASAGNLTSTTNIGLQLDKLPFHRDGKSRGQGGAFWSQITASASAGAGDYAFNLSCNIGKATVGSNTFTHPAFSQCRLYVPLYTMTNEEVSRYLTLQPTKQVVYRDIFQYQIDVGANGVFNSLLTNGIANPKSLVVIPYIQTSANATGLTSTTAASFIQTLPVWQSPFSSEPGTTSPYISLKDYNVQLAGVNVYTSNYQYDFETFRNELARANCINGGVVDGLTSGLIGYEDFLINKRYYVTDLSRRIKAEDSVPKSIQISGQNNSSVPITLFVFLEFERSINISLDSGLLIG